MNFFSSDLHFGSEQTLASNNRPFKNANQFVRYVVKVWNKQAKKGDTIWCIGDFISYHSYEKNWEKYIVVVKKFKAKVVLIMGNNENRVVKECFGGDFEKFRKYCIDAGFCDVLKDAEIEMGGNKFYLVHKPIDHKEDCLNLFGHSHNAMGIYKSFGFNIGCDLNHFRLFSEKDIKHLVWMKENYWDADKNLKLI